MNTRDNAYLIADSQARDLQNVQGTPAGAIVKRSGLVSFATPADVLTSLFACEATASPFLIGAGTTKLYSIASDGTIATIKTGLTSGERWEFITAPAVSSQGPLFGMNGADTPQQWTGSSTTGDWTNTSGSVDVPNGTMLVSSLNQIFVAGVSTTPSRLYWSAIGDPTNWDSASDLGAGFMDLDPDDGQAISGLGVVGPYVMVCKPRKIWFLIDPASATVRQLSNNVGCVAHRSIATGAAGTYFLSEDRVYLTNGSKLQPVSDIIQPTVDSIQAGLRSQAAGACFNTHYYLSVPLTGTDNDTTLDWDETLQSWWKHSFGSNQMAIWHLNDEAGLYSAKSTDKFVDQAFVSGTMQDNGTDFEWVWRGPWQSPIFFRHKSYQVPFSRKRLRQLRVDGSGNVDFSIAKDFAGAETLWQSDIFSYENTTDTFAGSGTFGGDGLFGTPSASEARLFTMGVARAFSFVFSATSSDPGEVTGYMTYTHVRADSQVY